MKKIANSLMKPLAWWGMVLIFSAIALFNMSKTMAQNTCQTATFIQVTDSCELTTYYQSGYDDRWFTFAPETPGIGFEIEWDYSPRWAYIPYDTLYIYTGSCDSLVEYAILSPIPTSGENYFNGDGDVFFRFTRDNSTPSDIEFDLCVFSSFMEPNCVPEILASSQVICLGECFNITNSSMFFTIPNIYFELIIDPPAEIWNAAGTHYYGTYGVISGGQNYIPTFINTNDELKICPVNSGAHNIHAIWYDFLYHPDYIRCEDYEYIDVYDTSISDIDVFGTPCDLIPISTYIIPAFEVPCCVENINYSYTHTDQNPTLEIEWVFHENISINSSNYVYYPTYNYVQGIVLETNVATIISELNMNCTDTFYLSMIIHGICIDDTLTKGFVLTAPEVHFISNNVCLGSSTEFNAWVHPDCIELWQWNFGDGTIITGQNMHDVFHTYSSSGTFQASLTVYYHNGLCSVVVSHPVIVSEVEKPEFSVPWEWACADEIVFTIENYDPSLHYFYTIDDPFAPFETLPVTGASSPLPQVEIPWPGMTGGIIYIHVLDDNGCYAYDSLVVFNCCFDASSGEFYYNHTFSGNQTMTGQSFYINGTIDFAPLSNYQFIDCNFYFSPNSKMIIPDFANVSIDKSGVLQACEPLMWDGIYVYGSGSLTISGGSPTNVLIQDAKHAVVSTDGGQFLIRKTTFDINYNHLAVFNYPCENHTGEIYASELLCTGAILPQYPPVVASKTRFAIELSIVKNITIGKSGGPHQRNLIENCDVGLYSRNSNVNVINNHFKNISAQTNVTPGMPSHPRGYGIYSFLWPMGYPVCPGNPPMFDRGISTVMQQNTIANYFTNCNRGIASYDNKIVNISKNKFSWDNNQFGAIAIDLLKSDLFGGYNTLKKVSANQISGYRFGIRSIVDHVLVEGNTIEKLYLPFSIGSITSAGIEVNGATDVIIKSNTVDNSSMTLNSRYEGVRVTQSYSTIVMCNTLKNLGKAIRFSGNCIPAEIKLNSMHNSIIGFCLSDTGFTGQQGMIGEPWDNKWYGTFTYHLYTLNYTNGQLSSNRWYISEQTGPKNPLGFYSHSDFPISLSTPIAVNTTSGMLLPGLCAIPMLTFQVPYQPLLDEIALDQIPALQNPQHRRWMSKNGLIRTIDVNPNLMQSSILSSFRTSQDFESTGQLIAIRDTVSNGYIYDGKLLNDALVPVSEPDSLAIRINSILLNADYDNARFFADAFDNMAVSLLQQYAQLCPYVHGNHVYISRMLLQMIGDTTEYQNICEEETEIISEKTMQQINSNTQLKLYPNPTSNYITFETDMPLPCTLYLYNSMGQQIDELHIIDNITVIDISKYKQQFIFYYINGISGKISLTE